MVKDKMSLTKTCMSITTSIVILNFFTEIGQLVNGRIMVAPKDAEVLVGQSTYFNCSTSVYGKNVTWSFYPVGGSGLDRIYVYDGRFFNPYINRARIDRYASGVRNLVLLAVTSQDAGRYVCQDAGGIGDFEYAQLVVLDANPVCNSSVATNELIGPNNCDIEPEELRLSCRVTYHGNIPPAMEWKSIDGNGSIAGNVTFEKEDNAAVTYYLTKKADLLMNGSTYICQPTKSTAHEIRPNCTSDTIRILYAISSISTVNGTVGVGITCFANASQNCSYKWKWYKAEDSTTESENATLIPKKSGMHKCEATCQIKARSCTILVMTAFVSDKDDDGVSTREMTSSSGLDLGTALGTIFAPAIIGLLVIVVIIIVAILLRLQKRKDEKLDLPKRRSIENQDHIKGSVTETIVTEAEMKNKCQIRASTILKEKPDPLNRRSIEDQDRLTGDLTETIIMTEAAMKNNCQIRASTILKNEVFVITDFSQTIEVFDSTSLKKTRTVTVDGLKEPLDINSCSKNNCLYILDHVGLNVNDKIYRINRNGDVLKEWDTEDSKGRLSVSSDGHVIATFSYKLSRKVLEYDIDGKIICEIPIENSYSPFRAIKLNDNEFLICHGDTNNDKGHSVSRVKKEMSNSDNKMAIFTEINKYGDERGITPGKLNVPWYLEMDEKNGYVFVAERESRKISVLSLNPSLQFKGEFWGEKNGLKWPLNMFLDSKNDRLFVTDYEIENDERKKGRLLVLQINRPNYLLCKKQQSDAENSTVQYLGRKEIPLNCTSTV